MATLGDLTQGMFEQLASREAGQGFEYDDTTVCTDMLVICRMSSMERGTFITQRWTPGTDFVVRRGLLEIARSVEIDEGFSDVGDSE